MGVKFDPLLGLLRVTDYSNADQHGTVASGTEDFSANTSHHTVRASGSQTWTFSGFSATHPELSIKLFAAAGITITLPALAVVASDSAQSLSAMTAGGYIVEVVSFHQRLKFDAGSTEITAGATITGADSGATATVDKVVLESGTWAGNDAAGYIDFVSYSGTFQNNENIQVSESTYAVANGTSGAGYDIIVGRVD